MGTEFAEKDFLIARIIEEQGEFNIFLHYRYEIYDTCQQFCKEVMNLSFVVLHPWNIWSFVKFV